MFLRSFVKAGSYEQYSKNLRFQRRTRAQEQQDGEPENWLHSVVPEHSETVMGERCLSYKEGENGDMVFVSFEGDIVNGDAVEVEVERGSFNPCANPADSWPIIEKYRISIINLDEDEWGARGVDYCKSKRAIHENPLRAAMIVFLMMQRIQ